MDPGSPDSRPPDTDRRRFLRTGGAGVAAAGLVALGPADPAGASTPPSWKNLRDHFGAVGNGRNDDTRAVQRALRGLDGSSGSPRSGISGGSLVVPPGEYVLTDTVTIHRFAGIIRGAGVGNTPNYSRVTDSAGRGSAFRWAGPPGIPMFRITDSSHLTIRDLRFLGHDTATPSAALSFTSAGGEVGTNADLLVEDCSFGVWPWTQQGTYSGRLATGIRFDGINENNDQFRIVRCSFAGTAGTPATGITLANPQSIWGSVTDCTFGSLAIGVDTAASVTLFNPQFDHCDRDLVLRSTANVDLFGWNSERSRCLASLEPNAGLRVVGGTCQLDQERMNGPMIAAFPSGAGQTVSLTGLRFVARQPPDRAGRPGPRPAIEFGPAPPHACGQQGFLVRVDACSGLHADQCRFAGSLWAQEPESRGLVEWYSRNPDGIAQFRNELWAGNHPGTRTTVDTGVWDPPRAGSHD